MKSINFIIFIFICFLFSACSSAPPAQKNPKPLDVAQEFKSIDSDMNSARAKQVDILSPRNFNVANQYLDDAKKSISEQKNPNETLRQIALARDNLKRANAAANLSHANIEDVVIARQLAVAAGASGLFASDFQRADDLLQNITSDLEYNNIVNVEKNRSALKAIYSKLELAAIKRQNLDQARLSIAMAIKEGAKKYVPESLATAIKDYKDTSAYIDSDRHDVDQIKNRSLVANQSAYQLLQRTRESSQKNLVANTKFIEDKISTGQSALARGSKKSAKDKFEKVRSQFTKNEAEIKKQGNTLTIRLKGLKFPSSQAVLKDSNFPLLGKVQRVIKEYANSLVVVEGHTDSIGTKAINEKLSKERAKAVREYLLSVDAVPAKRIKVIAAGEKDPFATNKTPSGRAQNRRVDVIIKL